MISIIIPVLNEAKLLEAALDNLLRQIEAFEVIVVDGGSSDRTVACVPEHPGIRLVHAAQGRAVQMNAGAAVAAGDLLLFLHVDTRLPPGALETLAAGVDQERWEAGAFRHRFASSDRRLRLISAVHNLRCRLTRIYFGDQAIFVRRSLFEKLGGFPLVPVLEDVILCERLRRVTRSVLLDIAVTTDARRFLQHGIWRTSLRALAILVRHSLGLRPDGRGFDDEVR